MKSLKGRGAVIIQLIIHVLPKLYISHKGRHDRMCIVHTKYTNSHRIQMFTKVTARLSV